MVVFALARSHEIAIAAMGAVFIAFALVSSFVLPRRNPNFPNRHVGLYVVGTLVLFAAMLTTILVFGAEDEAGVEAGAAATSSGAGEDTSDDTGIDKKPEESAGTQSTESTAGGGEATGDAAAGKKVFESAGCTGCHTLEAAGSSGNVGPNLDQAKPDRALIHLRVTKGKGPMPPFQGQLSDKQIADVVEFVYSSTHG
jgi:mono/diheme cytochrome c family protein